MNTPETISPSLKCSGLLNRCRGQNSYRGLASALSARILYSVPQAERRELLEGRGRLTCQLVIHDGRRFDGPRRGSHRLKQRIFTARPD